MARTLEQILAVEKPEVVARAQAMATEMLLNIHLAELRERVQKRRSTWPRHSGSSSPLPQKWKNRVVT